MIKIILLVLFIFTFQNNHTLWDKVLKKYIISSKFEDVNLNLVDYTSIRKDQDFKEYIKVLENWNLDNITFYEKQALLINAYNAFTIKIIADFPCKIKFGKYCWPVQSIWDLGTIGGYKNSIWNYKVGKIGGVEYTLDEIEKVNLLNITDNKPGVHYSLVCGSVSCPNLRKEAYESEKLKQQFQEQSEIFLNDSTKGYKLDKEKNIIYLSKLFSWYSKDFIKGNGTVIDYLIENNKDSDYLRENMKLIKIEFMNYNWKLNDQIFLNKI